MRYGLQETTFALFSKGLALMTNYFSKSTNELQTIITRKLNAIARLNHGSSYRAYNRSTQQYKRNEIDRLSKQVREIRAVIASRKLQLPLM